MCLNDAFYYSYFNYNCNGRLIADIHHKLKSEGDFYKRQLNNMTIDGLIYQLRCNENNESFEECIYINDLISKKIDSQIIIKDNCLVEATGGFIGTIRK